MTRVLQTKRRRGSHIAQRLGTWGAAPAPGVAAAQSPGPGAAEAPRTERIGLERDPGARAHVAAAAPAAPAASRQRPASSTSSCHQRHGPPAAAGRGIGTEGPSGDGERGELGRDAPETGVWRVLSPAASPAPGQCPHRGPRSVRLPKDGRTGSANRTHGRRRGRRWDAAPWREGAEGRARTLKDGDPGPGPDAAAAAGSGADRRGPPGASPTGDRY